MLIWQAGSGPKALHGYVHAGHYHALAPEFGAHYPGGWIQMTW